MSKEIKQDCILALSPLSLSRTPDQLQPNPITSNELIINQSLPDFIFSLQEEKKRNEILK